MTFHGGTSQDGPKNKELFLEGRKENRMRTFWMIVILALAGLGCEKRAKDWHPALLRKVDEKPFRARVTEGPISIEQTGLGAIRVQREEDDRVFGALVPLADKIAAGDRVMVKPVAITGNDFVTDRILVASPVARDK